MATEHTTTEDDIHETSDRFYEALERMANGDVGPMLDVWSHRADVSTMHPIGGREVGWEAVKESWQAVSDVSSDATVTRSDQLVRVVGDVAYELTTEEVSMTLAGQSLEMEVRATNVYRVEDDAWKMAHHHADMDPEMVDILDESDPGV